MLSCTGQNAGRRSLQGVWRPCVLALGCTESLLTGICGVPECLGGSHCWAAAVSVQGPHQTTLCIKIITVIDIRCVKLEAHQLVCACVEQSERIELWRLEAQTDGQTGTCDEAGPEGAPVRSLSCWRLMSWEIALMFPMRQHSHHVWKYWVLQDTSTQQMWDAVVLHSISSPLCDEFLWVVLLEKACLETQLTRY